MPTSRERGADFERRIKLMDAVAADPTLTPSQKYEQAAHILGPFYRLIRSLDSPDAPLTAEMTELIKHLSRRTRRAPKAVEAALRAMARVIPNIAEANAPEPTVPAYVLDAMPSGEAQDDLIETMNADPALDSHALVVEQAGQTPVVLRRPLTPERPRRTLYHYTSTTHWPLIQGAGFLQTMESNVSQTVRHAGPDVVWLTDQPNLTLPEAGWAQGTIVDKTKVRITVNVADAEPALEFWRRHHIETLWLNAFVPRIQDATHWYVVERPIPSTEWGEVRIGDTLVGKRNLAQVPTAPPAWMNSQGGPARCDFCGGADMMAAWRHGCKPFTVGEWTNGDRVHPGEADWAACWFCDELISRRDQPALLARATAVMGSGRTRVVLGGKHSTESGEFEPAETAARIAGFFRHRTGKRVFIGCCDFCSMRGETVRWMYPAADYTARHPLSGDMIHTDTPWCCCEACSKLIDTGKTQGLVDRAVEHQLDKAAEEQGTTFNTHERGQVRAAMIRWFNEFVRHRTGPKLQIPDLPPRPIPPPQASPVAQQALDQKFILLQWAEGSDGRQYIGGWNDVYSGARPTRPRQPDDRMATEDELKLWTLPLRHGEAFYWETRVAREISQAAEELADDPSIPWTLRPELLPAPQGFFYSDTAFGEIAGSPLRAVGWSIAWDIVRSAPRLDGKVMSMRASLPLHGGGDPSTADGVALTFWAERPQGDRVIRPAGQLMWRFGADHRAGRVNDAERESKAEIFAAMLTFIEQKIVMAGGPMAVSSVTRKRIERDYPEHEPTVRVITLRRVQRMDYERPEESSGRHLSVQFRVRGHWRNACGNPRGHKSAEASGIGCKDHRTTYVHPYQKGPDDAPLRLKKGDVFDVSR